MKRRFLFATDRILFFCGLFLAACEIYKQLFLYLAVNGGRYDWWYFPFQLCSLPMYLCLIIPVLKEGSLKTAAYTFLQDYGILGGIAALLVPDGFCGIHWTLTLHGYVWHILLILIGVFIRFSGCSDRSVRGFARTLPLFFSFCAVALAINVLAPGHGKTDMFYISPYHPTPQPVFHGIALAIGILPANLIYLLCVCLGAFLIHRLAGQTTDKTRMGA
ncbi:MAG: YwaF family protein [Clostridiales bacterium]|nr:YwaF family protein [Clostridiales bacterium]